MKIKRYVILVIIYISISSISLNAIELIGGIRMGQANITSNNDISEPSHSTPYMHGLSISKNIRKNIDLEGVIEFFRVRLKIGPWWPHTDDHIEDVGLSNSSLTISLKYFVPWNNINFFLGVNTGLYFLRVERIYCHLDKSPRDYYTILRNTKSAISYLMGFKLIIPNKPLDFYYELKSNSLNYGIIDNREFSQNYIYHMFGLNYHFKD